MVSAGCTGATAWKDSPPSEHPERGLRFRGPSRYRQSPRVSSVAPGGARPSCRKTWHLWHRALYFRLGSWWIISILLRRFGRTTSRGGFTPNRRVHYRAAGASRQTAKTIELPEKVYWGSSRTHSFPEAMSSGTKMICRDPPMYNPGCSGIRERNRDSHEARNAYFRQWTDAWNYGSGAGSFIGSRNQNEFFYCRQKTDGARSSRAGRRCALRGALDRQSFFDACVPLGEKPELEYARQEIEEAQKLIGELAHADKLFRPMGGGGVIGPHLLSRAAQQFLQAGKYTCVLWSSVPGDWKDQDGWVNHACRTSKNAIGVLWRCTM